MAALKYDPKFCKVVLEIGAKGGWTAEMAEACDVNERCIRTWRQKYPEFKEACERAHQKAQAYYEKSARKGMFNKNFNAGLWGRQMAARHPDMYTEKKRTEISAQISVISGVPRTEDDLKLITGEATPIINHEPSPTDNDDAPEPIPVEGGVSEEDDDS
jgi:hypothetical protein